MDPPGVNGRFEQMLGRALHEVRGVSTASQRSRDVFVATSRVFEALLREIEAQLDDEKSHLRSELAHAQLDAETVRRQLAVSEAMLRQAERTGQLRWLRSGAKMMAALLGMVADGTDRAASAKFTAACRNLDSEVGRLRREIQLLFRAESAPTGRHGGHRVGLAARHRPDSDAGPDQDVVDLNAVEANLDGAPVAIDEVDAPHGAAPIPESPARRPAEAWLDVRSIWQRRAREAAITDVDADADPERSRCG